MSWSMAIISGLGVHRRSTKGQPLPVWNLNMAAHAPGPLVVRLFLSTTSVRLVARQPVSSCS
jgi:hypothetical protein